jgi:hypothetical protein
MYVGRISCVGQTELIEINQDAIVPIFLPDTDAGAKLAPDRAIHIPHLQLSPA